MRYPIFFSAALLLMTLLAACEKVVDLDLKETEKKYVIEGIMTNEPGSCVVTITQSKNFDENNDFLGISGALVTISDDTGSSFQLTETSAGTYEADAMTGISGRTYTLRVSIEAATFTANCTMPQLVNMDTLYITEENIFGEKWNLANIELQDPAGIENKYRYVQYVNDVKTKEIFIRDDGLVDGKPFATKLYMNPGTKEKDRLKSGDEVQIEMQCIDPVMYKYWASLLQSATGESQSASPANPVTNIQGGALGYFSVHTTERKTIIVP